MKNQRGRWVCWTSTSRNNGFYVKNAHTGCSANEKRSDASSGWSRRDLSKSPFPCVGYQTPMAWRNSARQFVLLGGVQSVLIQSMNSVINSVIRVFAEKLGGLGILVVCFLYETNPNPRNTICWGKKWPKCQFWPSFSWVELALGCGEFVGFIHVFQPSRIW